MNHGGPAFPSLIGRDDNDPIEQVGADTFHHHGMTLRDYFAGQALANLNLQAHVAAPAAHHLAQSAYEIADAMLAERERAMP